jgi:SAM-dependent methyltransferase
MTSPFAYDFGYSWLVVWGPLIPLVMFGGLAGLGLWLGWRRWLVIALAVPAVWATFSLATIHAAAGINAPQPLPTERFLASGSGRVVDVGAGSGRAAVGLLLARPGVTVTAVDIYSGYYGIDDNTPERFMVNARIAGVATRAKAVVGDARALPLASAEYDGVISSYAIDHITRDGIPKALSEVGRVLKPGGEFLLTIVNVDWWALLTSPHAIAHHPRANPVRWRTMLETAGFEVVEQGTKPMTMYFLSRKPHPTHPAAPTSSGG